MSSDLKAEQLKLKTLVARAAGKERRNLTLSILFTVIVLAIGFGWIAYSANRVVKLKAQEADLKMARDKLVTARDEAKLEVAEQLGLLRNIRSEMANVKPALDKCLASQETKIALAALSSAQQSLQVALNNPIEIETKKEGESPKPKPVLVVVPSVTKMAFTDAEQRVRALGLTATRVDQSGTAPPGTVLYQDPLPGQRLAPNSQVTLYVVPTSRVSTEVPDLKGLTFEEANGRLVRLGLTVRKVDQPGKGVPGTVLYQDPFTGRRVPPGSQVSLYIIPKGGVLPSSP